MKAYSMDLRLRVIAACDAGRPTSAVARTFDVSPAWVRRLKQHRRERGDLTPRTGGGRQRGKIDPIALAEHVRRHPDATLLERIEALGLSSAKSAMWNAMRRLKLSYKKSPSTPPSRTVPTSPNAGRRGG